MLHFEALKVGCSRKAATLGLAIPMQYETANGENEINRNRSLASICSASVS